MAIIQGNAKSSSAAGFYPKVINGSLRFNNDDSPILTWTPALGTEETWTYSCWVKRSTFGSFQSLLAVGTVDGSEDVFGFNSSDKLNFRFASGSDLTTTQVFRDPSAWYHIVVVADTTQGQTSSTASDSRLRYYVNGLQITAFDSPTMPSPNHTFRINTAAQHYIGEYPRINSHFDGYLANVHFIDGQALTASDFGSLKNGVWVAEDYAGTFGTNGFYLTFDGFNGTTATDDSPNSNNWTANNLATTDAVLDSPTNNFATLNPLGTNDISSFSEGNLKITTGSGASSSGATMGMSSGKWYAEFVCTAKTSVNFGIALIKADTFDGDNQPDEGNNVGYFWVNNATINHGFANDSYGSSFNTGDIMGVAFDADTLALQFYINGTGQGNYTRVASEHTAGDAWIFGCGEGQGSATATFVANFGQDSSFAGNKTAQGNTDENGRGDFYYAPPSGYLALCTANLPAPTIDPAQDSEPRDYFETFLYTGNGGGLQVGDVIKKPADTMTISSSLLFDGGTSTNLTRSFGTPSTDGRKKFTISVWIKRAGNVGANNYIFEGGTSYEHVLAFEGDILRFGAWAGSDEFNIKTNGRKFKDIGRWYHIVCSVDTTQGTPSDRVTFYVDGIQLDPSELQGTYPAPNYVGRINTSGNTHIIGKWTSGTGREFNGYMAEFHFVDGTAYAASNFGNFDANGIWIPKTVSGLTYGNNGFYLDFADNTSLTTLGDDESGNTNDWTVNSGFATTDQVADSPTNNFMTMSSANADGTPTLSEGNLRVSVSDNDESLGSFKIRAKNAGKFYWEVDYVSSAGNNYKVAIGIANDAGTSEVVNYGHQAPTYNTSNLIGIALDTDNQTIEWYKDGVSMGAASDYSYKNWDYIKPLVTSANSAGEEVVEFNFGQKTFAQTPPTGYLALSENNITVDDQNLESPDLVWIKNRDNGDNHYLYDKIRGVTKTLSPDIPNAEYDSPSALLNFNTNGFTVGSDGGVNRASQDYVAWCWKAGGLNNTYNIDGIGYASMIAAGLSDGSIATTGLSVNRTSGFSITRYTGSNSGTSIAHGLGKVPDFILVKALERSAQWLVWHNALNANQILELSTLAGVQTDNIFWNNQLPTSSYFYVPATGANGMNANGEDMLAYCFHSVDGFSKFGSYQGNNLGGNDGPFVYLGFQPALVILKYTGSSNGWFMFDNAREPNNHKDQFIMADMDAFTTEFTQAARGIDFVSNGFKLRTDAAFDPNASGTYIYMAWAESPFKFSTAR